MATVYVRYAQKLGLRCELLTSTDSHTTIQVIGSGAGRAFGNETGIHCVQRVPKTSRKPQTSLVAVAVLGLPPQSQFRPLPTAELDIKTQCGSGPGGQHQNKTESAVRVTHTPTGIQVFINGRDQHRNKADAIRILTARVNEHRNTTAASQYATERRSKLGDGGRGGKVRTYNFMDGRVVDHRLGTKTGDVKGVMRGDLEQLLKSA